MLWAAARSTRPSISLQERRRYESLYKGYGGFEPMQSMAERHSSPSRATEGEEEKKKAARSRSGGGGGDDDTTVEEDKKGAEYGREANFSVAAADHDTSALRRSRGGGDEGESPQRRLRTALK